jgi:galactoside O-acetyltransferase
VQIIISEFFLWIEAFFALIPGKIGRLIRRYYFRSRLNKSGPCLSIGRFVEFSSPKNISFGNEIYIVDGAALRADDGTIIVGDKFAVNGNVRIVADCGGKIIIGNSVMIGPNTVIRASNHQFKDAAKDIWLQGQTGGTITIGDDVWIAANVVILAGVRVGSHSVIAAGAVVTKDVPEYSVIGGVPAKLIRKRITHHDLS